LEKRQPLDVIPVRVTAKKMNAEGLFSESRFLNQLDALVSDARSCIQDKPCAFGRLFQCNFD